MLLSFALVACEEGDGAGTEGGVQSESEGGVAPPNATAGAGGGFSPGPIIEPTASKGTSPSDDAGEDDGGQPRDGGRLRDAGDPCGNGKVDPGEKCDPAKDACCNDRCSGPSNSGAVCRAAAGACDIEETCDGSDLACPADARKGFGQVCRAQGGVCDVAEICNGSSANCPTDQVAPDSVTCGNVASGECDLDDHCDGVGKSCPDVAKPNGVTCGSSATSECDNPDTCNGSGECLGNEEAPGTACTDQTPSDCQGARCDGSGACDQVFENENLGYLCGDQSDTTCTNPDTCDAGGTCLPNHASNAMVCRGGAGECDVAETCSNGVCPSDGFKSPGAACTDTTTSDCKNAACDGSGTCSQTYADESSGYLCGDQSDTTCTAPDTCDGGGTCLPNDASNATVCRGAAGECDVEETCNNGTCPGDTLEAPGTPCIDTAPGDCKDAQCDASGTCDQAYADESSGYLCGDQSDTTCTAPDTCDGGGTCLSNHASNATVCRGDAGDCDIEEFCSNGVCPADTLELSGTPCGDVSALGVCDKGDTCDGSGGCQTNLEPASVECAPKAGPCDIAEFCLGNNPDCPTDTFEPGTTLCRGSKGACDFDEYCPGNGPACPPDLFEDDLTTCDLPPATGNGACSQGLCCPGATTNDGSGCGMDPEFGRESNLVFVTSQQVPGGGFVGGRAGGAGFCNMLSQAANLRGTYSPWLGDSFFDVFYDISDGPYHRVDGQLVAPDKPALLNTPSVPLQFPIEITELNLASVQPIVLTGLSPDGLPSPNNCGDWMDPTVGPSNQADVGGSNQTGPQWTFAGSPYFCAGPARIYCFQDDCPGQPNVDLDNDPNNCGQCGNVCQSGTCAFGVCDQGLVFVTSMASNGNFGGLQGADDFCRSHAVAASLPGEFTAWLGSAAGPASARIIDQPYVRVDGSPVASGVAHLTAATVGNLFSPINVDESGSPVSAVEAWTGTWGDGSEFIAHCNSWTVGSGDAGAFGNPQAVDDTWTYDTGIAPDCAVQRPIYCFQSGPLAQIIIKTATIKD